MYTYSSHKTKIFEKISKYVRTRDLSHRVSRIFTVFTIAFVIFLLLSIIETIGYFSTTIRLIIFLIFAGLALGFLIYESTILIKDLIGANSFRSISEAAKEIGTYFPGVKDKLINVLQILRSNKSDYSDNLVKAAFEDVYKKVESLNFNSIINYSKLKKSIFIFSSILLMILVLFFSNSSLWKGAERLMSFNTEFTKPKEFSLKNLTIEQNIKKGEDVEIIFQAFGKAPKELNLKTRTSEEIEFNNNMVRLDTNNHYNLRIRNLKTPLLYFAHKAETVTDTFKIDVITPPVISGLNFEIVPPNYSKLKTRVQENNGNIIALKGTSVNFELNSSKILSSAKRISSGNISDSLLVMGDEITGNFTVTKNDFYYFEIIDEGNHKNETPIKYEITTISDKYPLAEIFRPEKYSLIPANDILTINYSISDDFGFSKVLLRYKIISKNQNEDSKKFTDISLKFDRNEIEQALFYNWDLTRSNLRENEEIIFFLEVYDNDLVSGPKSFKTELYKLRVPTLNELFAEADKTQESVMQELSETLKEAEKLQKDFQQIRNELKQDKEKLNWNEKERVNESLAKFEELSNKLEKIQEKLDNMRENISENNLLSDATMEKYNELQDLMDEINSDDLQKALENMQKSLENLLRDNVQKSLENMSINEEFFKKSIERTINLLKKIQIEQKMDEIIKRTEKLIDDLEESKNATQEKKDNITDTESDQMADKNRDIEKQLESLKSGMENLQFKMEDLSDMPLNEMKEINQKFEKQKNEELAKNTTQQLQEKNLFDALKNQQKVSENMASMLSEMENMQMQMQQQSQQMVMQNMLKSIDNIISLSKDQESFSNEINQIRSRPKELPGKAEIQMEMMQSLDNILKQLSELSQKTFAITPEMGQALGNARRSMSQSVSGMQNRNSQKSTFNQTEAMKSLNEAALMLQNSLKAMMQGGGQGGGMMSLMQQLQQMAQQQLGLNKMTQLMQQGKLNMQQQAQLQRLAQQQASIQKSLSELNQEARESGQSKKLSANLEKVLEDMKEVVSGLNTQKIDDNLIKKQEKILSKLLDAQRSINERDFEENRESFSGKDFFLNSPDELILGDDQSQDLLKEELLKSIQNGYSKDYENIIRRYFENLNQKSYNNN